MLNIKSDLQATTLMTLKQSTPRNSLYNKVIWYKYQKPNK